MRIAVCLPQVPFEHGGAEILSETLVDELNERGHEATLVSIPFKWYPEARVLTQALLWRLADLEEANGRAIDLVVATKFPSYAVRHPNKVVWLVHQFRQAYELDGSELGQFGDSRFDRATRRAVQRLDRAVLGEARRLFAISGHVAARLERSTGLPAEVLIPPPQPLEYRYEEHGDFVLSVGRLDRAKRVDLLLDAAAQLDGQRAVVVGDGPDRERLERLAAEMPADSRVTFLGRVDRDELASLYARCLAVYYAPVDEDLGLVPFEAFRSQKPVITTRDVGAPLDVVTDRKSGVVCEPTPSAVADAWRWLSTHPDRARELGRFGATLAERMTWDRVVDRLLGS
jgi:glycosyltransferase involved in cell wall biosynthesis